MSRFHQLFDGNSDRLKSSLSRTMLVLGAGTCEGGASAGAADGGVDCAGLPDGEGVVGVAASPAHDTARRQMAIV